MGHVELIEGDMCFSDNTDKNIAKGHNAWHEQREVLTLGTSEPCPLARSKLSVHFYTSEAKCCPWHEGGLVAIVLEADCLRLIQTIGNS